MKLREFLDKERISIFEKQNKEKILLKLIEMVSTSPRIDNVDRLREEIFHREELMSTGIGLGIGVPHVRIEGVYKPLVSIGVCSEGIDDYESIDEHTIKIVVMIVAGKWQHKEYIQLLSLIVSKMKNGKIRQTIIKSKNPEEIYNILVEEES